MGGLQRQPTGSEPWTQPAALGSEAPSAAARISRTGMWTWASEGCEAPAQWPMCCAAGAEQALGGRDSASSRLPENCLDSRALSLGRVCGQAGGALGSAVHTCLALSDSCPVLPFRGLFGMRKASGCFGVQERAFRLSSSPRGCPYSRISAFHPIRICHSSGWPKWCWQIHSDFPPC